VGGFRLGHAGAARSRLSDRLPVFVDWLVLVPAWSRYPVRYTAGGPHLRARECLFSGGQVLLLLLTDARCLGAGPDSGPA
jgi:hypothetical protein